MSYIITSSRSLIQLAFAITIVFFSGITLGLKLTGPFSYLETQTELHNSRTRMLSKTVPSSPEPLQDLIAFTINTAYDATMRGVTIGYNAPAWVHPEHVFATMLLVLAIAGIILTRAWTYTTWIPIE